MTFYYNDVAYDCSEGQFILIRPGVPHAFDCSGGELSQPHVHFDMIYTSSSKEIPVSFKDKEQMTAAEQKLIAPDVFEGFPLSPFVTFDDAEQALDIFYRIIDCFSSGQRLIAKGALTELLGILIGDNFPALNSKDAQETYGVALQIKHLIDSVHGVGISLDTLEKQFSYSKFYLERKFKQAFGTSLISYVNLQRMDFARELLHHYTVSETAERTGFSSIYSFSRAYKNRFGIPPTQSQG